MELVSIVVPIYNTASYLDECIDSILDQSHRNIELILVDDGSKDDSLALCNHYQQHDQRVKVIAKPNTGVSDTRNTGIAASRGVYICFVDSDDVLKPEYVETLLQAVSDSGADVVFCNFEYLYGNKRIRKKPRLASGRYTFADLEAKIVDDGTLTGVLFGSAWMAIYKKSLLDKHQIAFKPQIQINEDGIFNIEYCIKCADILVLGEAYLYEYRQEVKLAKKVVPADNIFAAATREIRRVCEGEISESLLDTQMRARKVSEALWMIVMLCSNNNLTAGTQIVSQVRNLLGESELRDSFSAVDPESLNRYKAVYFWLMKHRMSRSLYWLTRFVLPRLSRMLAR